MKSAEIAKYFVNKYAFGEEPPSFLPEDDEPWQEDMYEKEIVPVFTSEDLKTIDLLLHKLILYTDKDNSIPEEEANALIDRTSKLLNKIHEMESK